MNQTSYTSFCFLRPIIKVTLSCCSMLGCITAWFGNYSSQDHKKCQLWMKSCPSCKPTSASIDIIDTTFHGKAANVIKDHSRPSHSLFSPLPLESTHHQIQEILFPAVIRLFNGSPITSGCIPNLPIYLIAALTLFYLHFLWNSNIIFCFLLHFSSCTTCCMCAWMDGMIFLDSMQNNIFHCA